MDEPTTPLFSSCLTALLYLLVEKSATLLALEKEIGAPPSKTKNKDLEWRVKLTNDLEGVWAQSGTVHIEQK